jgi:hypothetical protein
MPLIIDLLEDVWIVVKWGLIIFRWLCDGVGGVIVISFFLALIIKR